MMMLMIVVVPKSNFVVRNSALNLRDLCLFPVSIRVLPTLPAQEAYAVPYVQCTWDFFLSHKQSNAQDAVSNLRVAISDLDGKSRLPSGATFLLS